MQHERFIQVITRYFLFALGLVAALSFSAFMITNQRIAAQETGAAGINISGRQRMLTQRITLYADFLVERHTFVTEAAARQTLTDLIDQLEASHEKLISGKLEINRNSQLSPEMRRIYFEEPIVLDAQMRRFIDEARLAAQLPDDEADWNNPHFIFLASASQGELLDALDMAVAQRQQEAERAIQSLKNIEWGVLVAIFLTLLAELIFIFWPIRRRIQQETHNLIDEIQRHKQTARHLNKLSHARSG